MQATGIVISSLDSKGLRGGRETDKVRGPQGERGSQRANAAKDADVALELEQLVMQGLPFRALLAVELEGGVFSLL